MIEISILVLSFLLGSSLVINWALYRKVKYLEARFESLLKMKKIVWDRPIPEDSKVFLNGR